MKLKRKLTIKAILVFLGCTLTVVLAVMAFVPFIEEMAAVEVVVNETPAMTGKPAPGKPKECLVTAIYEMEELSLIHI